MASATDRHVVPWELRAVEALRLPEWVVGLAIAGGCALATFLAEVYASPLEHPRAAFELRLPYVMAAILAFVFAAFHYAIRRAAEDLTALRPHLGGSSETYAAALQALRRFPRRPLWIAGGLGVVIGIFMPEVVVSRLTRLLVTGDWNLFDLWMTIYMLVYWCVLLRIATATVLYLLVFRRVGAELIGVRLFDPAPGRPLARVALRGVVLGVAGPFVILSAALAWGAVLPAVAGTAFFFNILLATAALLLPPSGLRPRIREAKRAEIARIDRAIGGEPAALEDSLLAADAESLRLVDLLAYRREVADLHEWPFQVPELTRFAFMLLLPVLSWIAGALVERLVDRLLSH